MPISGKEMVKRFKKAGWILDRISGSHHVMKKGNRSVSIPVHGNQSLKKGIETALLKVMEE